MTVYVDEFPTGWGKWSGGGHMLGSDLDELHEIASRIGLKRAWFQDKTFAHYDLTRSKRTAALAAGAIPIDLGHNPGDVLMRCQDGSYETRAERKARRPVKRAPTTT